jgi:PAS domain S-box-containing protein
VAAELTGWGAAGAGGPVHEVFHIVSDDPGAGVEDPTGKALRAGVLASLGNRSVLIARDGTARPIDGSAAPIRDARGDTLGAVLVFRDITQRKRMEEALRERSAAEIEHLLEKTQKILDNIPTGVLALSDAEITVAANRVLRDRMPPSALGAPLPQAFPEAPSATILRLRQLIEKSRISSQVQSLFGEFLTLFGEEERYNVHVVPLEPRLPDARFLIVIEDLSEVRALEGQLLRAEKLATVGVLAAGIAHEIGTPMGVVRGRAEYVLGKLGPEHPQASGMRVIIDQIDHVAGTMRQLLDFSRVKPAAVHSVGVAATTHTVLELLRLEAQRRQISTFDEVSHTLPDVAADPDQLQQVLVNLVMNSLDACAPGGRVTIRGQLEDAPRPGQSRVRLEVDDDGCGISEENRNQVFDPFFTTKKRGAGSGLGLSVVAQIVRNHGGEVALESEPGRGTCITLHWPTASPGAREEDHGGAA